MNGFTFYAEMQENRSSKSASKRFRAFTRKTLEDGTAFGQKCNCLAMTQDGLPGMREGFVPIYETIDSPVCWSSASLEYIRIRCVRVSESLARKLHPELFRRLDAQTIN